MSPRKTNGGGRDTTPTATATKISTATKPQDHQQDSATANIPVVFGVKLLASGSASYDRIFVRRCCWCGYPHLHILFEHGASTIERAPACRKHTTYLVKVVDVVPAPSSTVRRSA